MSLLSIVTVTYNAEKYIEITAESILKLSGVDFEWIIIDGLSTDRTIEKIQDYCSVVKHLVIESDTGIYNAMNKARLYVDGKYVLFLNAGDVIVNLPNELRVKGKPFDILLAPTIFYSDSSEVLNPIPRDPFVSCYWSMPVIHQSIIFSREILDSNNWYNEDYKIVADYDLLIRIFMAEVKVVVVSEPLSKFYIGDFNWKNSAGALSEKRIMLNQHFPDSSLRIFCGFALNLIKALVISRIFNLSIYQWYRGVRYG